MNKIEKALLVMVTTPDIRVWLRKHDPKALAQAFNALHDEGTVFDRASLVDMRRDHCLHDGAVADPAHPMCGGSGKNRCDCSCGPCTADYDSNGVWR